MEKRKIKFWDLVFMNVSALYGIRWLARSTASSFGLGLGAIPMWVIFAFIFFVPQALICAELASTYPRDGGLYEWVKEAFGEKWGFMVSWLNWTSKIFWYASFLTFLSVNVSYAIGKAEWADSQTFVLILSVVIFWILSLLSVRGMAWAKVFTNIGALGSTIPTILLIAMAFISVVVLKKAPSASTYSVATMMPKLNADSLVAISAVMFGLAGAETTANFVTEMDKPEKNFPKAIMTAAAIVGGLYVVGSIAITMILPPEELSASKGVLDALATVAGQLGIGVWFVRILAAGISLAIFGQIILYVASPIKMLFGSVKKGIFPELITKTNDAGIPKMAVLLQAILVTVLLVGSQLLPGVDAIYNVLVTMTALTALFPYVLLFLAYSKLRKDRPNEKRPYEMTKNNGLAVGISNTVMIICVLGIICSAAPVMGSFSENLVYEIQMIGGGLIVILSGLMIWKRFENRNG